MQQQDNHEYPFLYQRQTCHQVQPNQATYQKRQKCQPATYLQDSVNFCVMEAIKLCRLDTPIIFIEARINLSRFVVTGCAAKTSATVTFPSLNLISLFAFCFNIWLNGVAS